MVFTSAQVLFYSLITILILFFLGYGLSAFFIPKSIKPYNFWLIPWFAIIFLIFSFVFLNLVGLTVRQSSPLIIVVLVLLTIYAFIKKKIIFFDNKENILIIIFIIISLFINMRPVIFHDRFLTSVSFGNNDAITYIETSEFLINHTILEGLSKKAPIPVHDLLVNDYRWGPPIIASFFINLYQLSSYQFFYLFLVILYVLFIPLVYVLYKVVFKPSIIGLILTISFTAFNVNLLYFLYHNFFGQVIFWGFNAVLLILFFLFLKKDGKQDNKTIFEKLFIGFILGILYLTYNEAAVFVLAPLILYLFIKFIFNTKKIKFLSDLFLIIFSMFIVSPYALIHSFSLYFKIFNTLSVKTATIGWPPYRIGSPYANPLEMSGLYSIHSFKALPFWIAIAISFILMSLTLYGAIRSKNPLLATAILIIYFPFYIWKGIYNPFYFDYYRIVVSTLPFLIVLFVGGISYLKINKYINSILSFILISLLLYSSYRLNVRFYNEHLSIEKSFVSLSSLAKSNKYQKIYSESVVVNGNMLWANHNIYYFLKPIEYVYQIKHKNTSIENILPDNSLILLSKPTLKYKAPKILITNIVWENEYYKLGKLCNSDTCLLESKKDLSIVEIGKSEYEDSLLTTGWSTKEPENRWSVGHESTLRLVAKKENYDKLVIEALTLNEPQELSVYINDQFIGKQRIKKTWALYEFNLNNMNTGIINIKFVFTKVYKPIELGISQDARELSANFRMIKLE